MGGYQNRHNPVIGANRFKELTNKFLELLPPDIRQHFAKIEPKQRDIIIGNIISAATSSTNSGAFKFRFENSKTKSTQDVFITVTDDHYHMHDVMAATAGVYLGSFINPALQDETVTDKDSMRAYAYAHETGHGARDDGLIIIRDNKVIVKGHNLRTPMQRLEAETGADRLAHTNYKAALTAGIEMSKNQPDIDHALRAASAYFSYPSTRADDPKLSYEQSHIQGYLQSANPLPWHATSAALEQPTLPDMRQVAAGVLAFRQDIDRTLGELFFHAANNTRYRLSPDLEKAYARDLGLCQALVDDLPDPMKDKSAQPPYDATTFFGNCVGHGTFTRAFAINAAIQLEAQGYTPQNEFASIYFREFSEIAQGSIYSTQFLAATAEFYIEHQRESLPAATRDKWDKFYVSQGFMTLNPKP